jgi:hypothetical protein
VREVCCDMLDSGVAGRLLAPKSGVRGELSFLFWWRTSTSTSVAILSHLRADEFLIAPLGTGQWGQEIE